jgi:long-chain fatty acid transport protein
LTLIKILPTASYRFGDQFSIGVSPVIGYGEFALNESLSSGTGVPGTSQTTRNPHGSSGFGVEFGVVGKFIPDVTLGASFITKSNYKYKELTDLEQFNAATIGSPAVLDDVKVQQPAEFAVGITYKPCECLVLSFDYRNIGWGSADGYKDFNWVNQNIFALGAQYQYQSWYFRAGVNYAKTPIEDSSGETGTTDFQGHTIMNQAISILDMFPLAATTSTHVTFGTGYEFTKEFSADVSFVFAPKTSVTRGGTSPLTSAAYSYTSTSQQWAIGFGGTYKF